ncbi:Transcription regulatory protein SNF5 [Mollivirus sibericum]|uniref:Transcription regulatory protein SNF5 n=1 Tax=Mollivirus sibericum TaxID=1678078 RepID=UPI0006B2E605|nr:Transcription regulatory protein SNF5 [Mollivirus sibericum]ALD62275.1 Transcription regulatory protein SNF5 [Mollivirus sibericum]
MDRSPLVLDESMATPWILCPIPNVVLPKAPPIPILPKLPIAKPAFESKSHRAAGRRHANNDVKPYRKHRRYAPEIDRKYKCVVASCGKSYGTESALFRHFDLKHPTVLDETRPFKCKEPECHGRFRSSKSLSKHYLTTHKVNFALAHRRAATNNDYTSHPIKVAPNPRPKPEQPTVRLALLVSNQTTMAASARSSQLLDSKTAYRLILLSKLSAFPMTPKPAAPAFAQDHGVVDLDLNDP